MLHLIFLSLLLLFGGRFVEQVVKKNDVPIVRPVEIEQPLEPSSSPAEKKESKVEGAKIEVKVETKSTSVTPQTTNENLNSFKYPNSKLLSSSPTSLTLESTDDSGKITDWYKQKILEKNMNVRTFVTTNTNGKIENKLVGADGSTKIQVEIAGQEGATLTIKIDLSSN